MMVCAATAACATFAASVASASPVMTIGGSSAPVGSSWVSRLAGTEEFSGFNVVCSATELKGTVIENSGTKIKLETPVGSTAITGTATGGDCTSSLGATRYTVNSKLCLETIPKTDNATATGCGGSITFTLEVTAVGSCKYSTASAAGTFKTNEDFTFQFTKQPAKLEEGGVFCPSEGNLFTGTDLLTTESKTVSVS